METHEKVKKLRGKFGISQNYMADALNMTQPAYNKLENGKSKLNIDHIKQIAKEFGMQVSDLVKEQESVIFQEVKDNQQVNGIHVAGDLGVGERDAFKASITHLQEEIAHLRAENSRLLALLEKKS